ncbi:hypothetical protein D3C80_1946400 [compost metagenome]
MPIEKHCHYCGIKLVNRRSHAKHCSSSCRGKTWRSKQEFLVPVKLHFRLHHFERLKHEALVQNIPIEALVIARSIGSAPAVTVVC